MKFADFKNSHYEANLLPTIPPDAQLSSRSSIHASQLGKIPGKSTANGWVGFAKWSEYSSTAQDLDLWDSWQPCNLSLRCAERYVGFDIDSEDKQFVAACLNVLRVHLGSAPTRGRSDSERILLLFAGNVAKRAFKFVNTLTGEQVGIDLLGRGSQFIMAGTHPKGGTYQWDVDLLDYTLGDLTFVDDQSIERVLNEIAKRVQALGWQLQTSKSSLRDPIGLPDVQQFQPAAHQIDVTDFHGILSHDIIELIIQGVPVGQRSEAQAKVVTRLMHLGLNDNEIANILFNEAYGIGSKCREQGEAWTMEDIARMRAKFLSTSPATTSNTGGTSNTDVAPVDEKNQEGQASHIDLSELSEESLAARITGLEKHCPISDVAAVCELLVKIQDSPVQNRLISLIKKHTGMHKGDILELIGRFRDDKSEQAGDEPSLTHHQLALTHLEYDRERDITSVSVGDSLFTLNNKVLWEPKPLSELVTRMCSHMDGQDNFRRRGDYVSVQKHVLDLLHVPEFFTNRPAGFAYNDGYFYTVVDKQLVVRPLEAQDKQTWMVDCAPDEQAPSQPWFDLLDQMFAGEDKDGQIRMLRELMCLSFLGLMPHYQAVAMLFGPPATGKSVLQEIWTAAFPDIAKTSVAPHMLSNEYYAIQLLPAAFNFISELHEEKAIDDTFKQFADGSLVVGRHPAGKPINFRSIAAQIYNANHLPYLKDKTEATIRRFFILQMENVVLFKARDPDIVTKIVTECMPFILWWALSIANEVLVKGITESATSKEMKSKWIGQANNVVEFFGDETLFEVDATNAIPTRTAYGVYKAWCRSAGYKAYGRNNFLTLASKAADVQRTAHKIHNPSGGLCIRGMKLTPEAIDLIPVSEGNLPAEFSLIRGV